MRARTSVAVDVPIYVLARSLPPSKYKPGRSVARTLWLIAAGLLAVLIVGLVIGPGRRCCYCGHSKVDIAKLTIAKYADEAYPEFRAANPTRECPVALRELNEWMNAKDVQDPWGTSYVMTCGNHTILVGSAGEDATFGTADDLWSNE